MFNSSHKFMKHAYQSHEKSCLFIILFRHRTTHVWTWTENLENTTGTSTFLMPLWSSNLPKNSDLVQKCKAKWMCCNYTKHDRYHLHSTHCSYTIFQTISQKGNASSFNHQEILLRAECSYPNGRSHCTLLGHKTVTYNLSLSLYNLKTTTTTTTTTHTHTHTHTSSCSAQLDS